MIDLNEIENPVILFDGVCNLCSSSVQFVVKHDTNNIFLFASLQSEFGKQVQEQFKISSGELETILLLKNKTIYKSSTAVLLVSKELNGVWKFFYALIMLPEAFRNYIYAFVARNRYKWFGKKERCWIPSKEISHRFLN